MSKFNLSGETVKKIIGISSIAIAGITAVVGALSDQRKQQEFEDLKKAVADLQNNR